MVAHLGDSVGRLVRATRGMRESGGRWLAWGGGRPTGPRIWVHAASVGEALTAEPILVRLKALFPDAVIAHTHTSASVTHWPGGWTADRTDFLPLPVGGSIRKFVDRFLPNILICPRADIWPSMIRATRRHGIPAVIVGGVIRDGSSRTSWPGRCLARRMVRHVAAISSVSVDDRERWIQLGALKTIVQVTGDPRDRHTLDRIPDGTVTAHVQRWLDGTPCFVAGSVERSDYAALRASLSRIINGRAVKAILAPHQPTAAGLDALEAIAGSLGIRTARWAPGCAVGPDTQAVIGTTTGHLRDLYRLAAFAYVGGGFEYGRLHSVAEAAAYGVPTAVGPLAGTSSEVRFQDQGARVLRSASPGTELADLTQAWLKNPGEARSFGLKGRAVLSENAADLSVQMLLPLLRGS